MSTFFLMSLASAAAAGTVSLFVLWSWTPGHRLSRRDATGFFFRPKKEKKTPPNNFGLVWRHQSWRPTRPLMFRVSDTTSKSCRFCCGVTHPILVCVRARVCLLWFPCIQRPFFKALELKWQPKQIETMKDQTTTAKKKNNKKKQPLVSGAALKHELMDWTVITAALWNQPLSPVHSHRDDSEGTAKPRCRTPRERHWCQTHVSPHSPTEIAGTISGTG